jgi:hypothetical protein
MGKASSMRCRPCTGGRRLARLSRVVLISLKKRRGINKQSLQSSRCLPSAGVGMKARRTGRLDGRKTTWWSLGVTFSPAPGSGGLACSRESSDTIYPARTVSHALRSRIWRSGCNFGRHACSHLFCIILHVRITLISFPMRVGRPTSPMRASLPGLPNPVRSVARTRVQPLRGRTPLGPPSQRETPGEPRSKNSVSLVASPTPRWRSSGLFECPSRTVACHAVCNVLGEVRKAPCVRDPELKLLASARVHQSGKL